MAYPITTTSGATIATIADGTVNSTATSLTLIGKNYAGYGNFLNENYVKLLENFSNSTEPAAAITGQLWYDSGKRLLKVYTGSTWKAISSSTAQSTDPSTGVLGDLLWNTTLSQLKVYNGTGWTTIGPAVTTSASGKTGAENETILDAGGGSNYVTKFYIQDSVIAILSSASFVPATAIAGFTTINPGLNLVSPSTVPGSQFSGDVSNALTLQGVTASQFLRSDQNTNTQYQITAGGGIVVGSDLTLSSVTATDEVQLSSSTLNRDFNFYVKSSSAGNASVRAIGITGSNARVTFSNAVSVGGTFTATGAFTAASTTTLQGVTTLQTTLLPGGNVTVAIGTPSTRFNAVYSSLIDCYGLSVGNITIGGSTGSSGQVLTSTGTGLQWYTLSTNYVSQTNGTTTSLGVGTAASGVAGEIRATNNITAYYSDERLKTRLGAIENALDKVDQLNGFYHEANETAQSLGYEAVREVGVSAQEVQRVLPEIVAPAPIDPQYLTVRYERLTPLLIEAIKELRQEVNALKEQIKR